MNIKLNIEGVDYITTPVIPPSISSTGLFLVPVSVTPQLVKLDALAWPGVKDAGTPGTAAGVSAYPVTIGGRTARSFPSDYTNYGGFRYHCSYDSADAASRNFVYAGDLYFDDLTPLAQMELDNNQVTADGKTYIFGAQANNNSGAWDVTKADSAPAACHWMSTAAKGCPSAWPAKTWLHFEIASHRDDLGAVTYDAVHFNGVTQQIAMTFPSAPSLGWAIAACLANLQLGGALAGSGSIRCYGSNLVIAKW